MPLIEMAPSHYFFIISICTVDVNVYARCNEIPSMIQNVFSHQNILNSKLKIFSLCQGQLNPQSMVGSGRISNSSKSIWLSLLSAKMKKIQKEGARVLPSRAANSAVSGRNTSKFEHI